MYVGIAIAAGCLRMLNIYINKSQKDPCLGLVQTVRLVRCFMIPAVNKETPPIGQCNIWVNEAAVVCTAEF